MRWSRLLRMGGGHGHASPASKEYGGFHAPHVNPIHQRLGTAIGALMWFWVFYRVREDGGALIGLHKPWEAHGHGHHEEAHGETHAEEKLQ